MYYLKNGQHVKVGMEPYMPRVPLIEGFENKKEFPVWAIIVIIIGIILLLLLIAWLCVRMNKKKEEEYSFKF